MSLRQSSVLEQASVLLGVGISQRATDSANGITLTMITITSRITVFILTIVSSGSVLLRL